MSEDMLIKTPCVFGENGNFLLERELGRGGMGGVYMGRDKMLDRPVAVKVMLREYGADPEFVEKFKREAQAAARLIHPNIAQVYSYGIADGMPYIAMELVAGGSLDKVMENSGAKTDVARVMKIAEQVAQALRCAADQGLVHGDVKPENILLDANGNAKLVDFGLAAMQKDTDEIWGTPYYIAPEKVKKEPVDYRSDMYSLGGTIYHALTGVAPFEGEDATAVVRRRFEGMPKKPSEVRSGISPQIDFLVMKMLAPDPAERYPSFEALLADFKKVMATGLSSTSTLSSTGAIPEEGQPGPSGRKVILKTRRRLTTKRDDEGGSEASEGAGGARGRRLSNGSDSYEDDEGGMGGKVALTVGGVIAAVALVVGGLIWYQAAEKAKEYREREAKIQSGYREAKSSLAGTRENAQKFAEEFDKFAMDTTKTAEGFSRDVEQLLEKNNFDQEVIRMLRPGPTAELVSAVKMAETNTALRSQLESQAEGVAKELAGVMQGVMKEMASQMAAGMADAMKGMAEGMAGAMKGAKGDQFPPPVGDEADPASPEGKKYLERKAEWEEKRKSGAVEVRETATVSVETSSGGKRTEVPSVVTDIKGIWEKAYCCQAAALHVRAAVAGIIADAEEAEKITLPPGEDDESQNARLAAMNKICDAANAIALRYKELNGMNEVANARKAKSFICGTGGKSGAGAKAVQRARDKFYVEEKERELEEARKNAEAEARRREAAKAEERKKKVAEEIAAARAAFDKAVESGKVRQLDWKGALRMLHTLRPELGEGQVELKKQEDKVACMKQMHDILIAGLKNYTFTRPPIMGQKVNLAGAKVEKVDDKMITVRRKGASRPTDIPWQTFCGDYLGSLDEIISKFIVKAGAGSSTGVSHGGAAAHKPLTNSERYKALIGVAYLMKYVCAEKTPSAAEYGDKMLFEAARAMPTNLNTLKEFFPDTKFDAVAAEISANQL